MVGAGILGHDRHLRAVRRQPRPGVVAALERHARGLLAGGEQEPVDLRPSRAVGGEVQRPPVRREHGLGIDRRVIGHPQALAGAEIQEVHVDVAVAGRAGEGQALAIRRERRRAVDAFARDEPPAFAGGERLQVDRRQARLERDVGERRTVRRPGRAHDRFARLGHDPAVLAVGIGDDEPVAPAGHLAFDRHVGDAGGERAAHADDVLVDEIGRPVRGQAPAALHRQAEAEQPLPGQHAEELELERRPAAGAADLAADHEVVDLDEAPGGEVDARAAGRRLQERAVGERLEVPAAHQIAFDDGRRVDRLRPRARGKGHDRDRYRRVHALGDLQRQVGTGDRCQQRQHGQEQRRQQPPEWLGRTDKVRHRGRIPA